MHKYKMCRETDKRVDFDAYVCAVVLGVEPLTSLAVQSSGKSWADPLSGCKTAPYNNAQSTHTKHT